MEDEGGGAESILAFFDLWTQAFLVFYFEIAKPALLCAREEVKGQFVVFV